MHSILASILAYLIGSLSSAILIARALKLPDPRTMGSHNPGATNMIRLGGKTLGAMTLLGDAFKGWLVVFLSQYLGCDGLTINCALIAVFLGHLFPIYFKFKGGKGVATALGIILGLNPWFGLCAISIWGIIVYCWRLSSLGSIVSTLLMPILFFVGEQRFFYSIALISVLILYTHRANLQRLIRGEESKI